MCIFGVRIGVVTVGRYLKSTFYNLVVVGVSCGFI